jgi:curved DNA-binding protein CbpA
MMNAERRAHLRVLGLTAAQDDIAVINKAYKLMALKYHPDRNGSASALAMMKLVNNAHDFLVK